MKLGLKIPKMMPIGTLSVSTIVAFLANLPKTFICKIKIPISAA